jgi:hypothetical protein
MGLGMRELPNPKKIFNIDNTTNKSGMITHYLDLNMVLKAFTRKCASSSWTLDERTSY